VLDNDTLFQLSDSVLDRDIKRALEILDNVYRSGHDIKKFYSEVMAHLRNLLVIKVGAGDELSSSIPSSEVKRLEEQAARMSELFLTQALSLMMADEEKVRFSQHPRIVMEMVFVKLAKTARALPVDMLIKKIDELKNELSSMAPENFSVPEVEPGPLTDEQDTRDKTFHAPHSEGETGPADTGKPAMDVNRVVPGKPDDIPDDKVPKVMGVDRAADWEAILAIIGDKHPLLAANLNNSTLTAVKDNRLEIKVYGSKTNRAILQRKQSLDNLKKICSDFFKKEMEISITYNANDTIGTVNGGTMKGVGNMLKQAQKLQASMARLQEELADRTVEATAGGGMVKAVANGRQQITSLVIEKEVVDPEDVEMLQDLVIAAVNEALAKSQEMVSSEMSKLAGGFNIPGLM